jgi:hypothetical protein
MSTMSHAMSIPSQQPNKALESTDAAWEFIVGPWLSAAAAQLGRACGSAFHYECQY